MLKEKRKKEKLLVSLFRENFIVILPSWKQEGEKVEISFILGLLLARQPLSMWSPDQRWRGAHLLAAHSLSVAEELKSRRWAQNTYSFSSVVLCAEIWPCWLKKKVRGYLILCGASQSLKCTCVKCTVSFVVAVLFFESILQYRNHSHSLLTNFVILGRLTYLNFQFHISNKR